MSDRPEASRWIEQVSFDETGLLPVVVQDANTHEALMVAYMNREALQKTCESGVMHFWSRSRRSLWRKGERSGHTQHLHELYLDCDGDALVARVHQEGGACHEGYRSCFFRRLDQKRQGWDTVQDRVFDPKATYGG